MCESIVQSCKWQQIQNNNLLIINSSKLSSKAIMQVPGELIRRNTIPCYMLAMNEKYIYILKARRHIMKSPQIELHKNAPP